MSSDSASNDSQFDADQFLIQRISDGDPVAWEDLIARYEGRLLAFVEHRLRQSHERRRYCSRHFHWLSEQLAKL